MHDMLNDAFGDFDNSDFHILVHQIYQTMTILGVLKIKVKKREKIKELLEDRNQELYDGCAKYSNCHSLFIFIIVRFYVVQLIKYFQ